MSQNLVLDAQSNLCEARSDSTELNQSSWTESGAVIILTIQPNWTQLIPTLYRRVLQVLNILLLVESSRNVETITSPDHIAHQQNWTGFLYHKSIINDKLTLG